MTNKENAYNFYIRRNEYTNAEIQAGLLNPDIIKYLDNDQIITILRYTSWKDIPFDLTIRTLKDKNSEKKMKVLIKLYKD